MFDGRPASNKESESIDITHQRISAYGAAVTAATVMGLLGVFVRKISADGELIAFARFALGFLFFTVFVLHRGGRRRLLSPWSPLAALSGALIGMCILSYIHAIKSTTLANAAFLLYLGPALAVALGRVLLAERVAPINAWLVLLALAGCGLILDGDLRGLGRHFHGNVYAVLAALLYASFIVVNRRIPKAVCATNRAFHELLFATLTVGAVLLLLDGSPFELWEDLGWVLAVGFFQGFLALWLMIFAIEYLETYEYGVVSYLEPVVATFAGIIVYAESVTLYQGVGCAIILASGIAQTLVSLRSANSRTREWPNSRT